MDNAAVGFRKVYFEKASVDSQEQLASRASSDILSGSTSTCNISHSENAHSLDSLKMPSTSEDPQMPHSMGISDTAAKNQDQDVLFSKDNSSSCVSKDDNTIVMSNDHLDDATHKHIKSSAASMSSFCQDSVEMDINGQLAGSSPLDEQFSVEGNSGQAVSETVGFSDKVDPSGTSASRDEPSGGSLSKGAPSECSVDQAESSSAKMPDLHNIDHKLNGESCVIVKPESDSNDDTLNSFIPPTNVQEPPVQGHTVPDNNWSDELVDVRVCDICGDVGREAMLALCSKCSDGAEHIYCMQVKMDQVPERDWVCEDCMLMQEPKRLKPTEVERSESTHNASYLKGVTQGLATVHSGGRHVDEVKTNHSNKQSWLPAKRPVPDMELKSATKRRALQRGIQQLTSPHFGVKTLLTCISSQNIMGKGKDRGPEVSSSGNQSNVELVQCTRPLSNHKSPKSGSLTEIRSVPKSINLEKNSQPHKSPGCVGKLRLTRFSSSKIMKKGKGSSHRESSFGVQSAKKEVEQEISPSGPRSPKPEQQFQPLKKSSSVPGWKCQLARVSSSMIRDKSKGADFQASSFGLQFAKRDVELEISPSVHRSPKTELQFQAPKPSSISGRKSKLTRVSSLRIIDKGKDVPSWESSLSFRSAKKGMEQASPLPGRRSQKCNPEYLAGSLSKSKPINIVDSNVRRMHEDVCSGKTTVIENANRERKNSRGKKLCKSMSFGCFSRAVSNDCLAQASNVENLRHGSERNSTGKRSAEVGLPVDGYDAMEGNSSGAKMVSEVISRPHSSTNDVICMMSTQVDENSDLEVLGSLACDGQSCENRIGESAQTADHGCPSREDESQVVVSRKILPVELHDMEKSPALTSADVASLGDSAVPESECIWKGAFQLEEGGKLPDYCCRIQAHLSTCASSKVLEQVPKFHPELLLKEVPHLDIWPVQFQKNCPTENDIALYFFAEDLPSHARSYTALLEGMIKHDLALEANFDEVQLLVFPSTLLSVGCQRWNDLLYLWGVFRVTKVDNHYLRVSSMNAATLNQGLCAPITCGALSRTLCASEDGSLCASHTSDNSIKGPESVNPKPDQSSSSTKSMNKNCEHDEVSSAEKCSGTRRTEHLISCKDISITLASDYIEKETFPDNVLHSNNFEREDDPVGYSNPETRIFQFSCPGKDSILSVSDFWQGENRLDVSRSSFSIDSGPSGSSDGAGCAKSDEGQVDQFQDPSSCKTLNLDLSLRPMSEPDIDLDLILGSPDTKKYEVKHFSNDRNSKHTNVSLLLSLGLPCANG